MNFDQIALFTIFTLVFALLIWGRWRYDLVAFVALLAALITGVVPKEQAFAGFGHPAVIIIALVLIVSRGLFSSGAIDLLMRGLVNGARGLAGHIAIISAIGAALSAVMNNVAALALLMPVDIQAAHRAKRSPALSLMPLSFATILGGMITLIGTPPNIIIAAFREQSLGESYSMFDFAPVGLAVALVGIAFVTLVGWRLIPAARGEHDTGAELFDMGDYVVELVVTSRSKVLGKVVADLDPAADAADAVILGLVRRGKRLPGQARRTEIRRGDMLVIQASPEAVEQLVGDLKLKYVGQEKHEKAAGGGMDLVEVVVPRDAVRDLPNLDAFTKWWGPTPDIQIVTFPLTRGEEIFIFATTPQAGWTEEGWTLPGDPDELRNVYREFHPEARALLDACTEVTKSALHVREPMAEWSRGHATLLGDAAHPMVPFMAQGACMAIEDAVVLARALDGVDGSGVPAALRRYSAARRDRTAEIQRQSLANEWMKQQGNADWVYGYQAWSVDLP